MHQARIRKVCMSWWFRIQVQRVWIHGDRMPLWIRIWAQQIWIHKVCMSGWIRVQRQEGCTVPRWRRPDLCTV